MLFKVFPLNIISDSLYRLTDCDKIQKFNPCPIDTNQRKNVIIFAIMPEAVTKGQIIIQKGNWAFFPRMTHRVRMNKNPLKLPRLILFAFVNKEFYRDTFLPICLNSNSLTSSKRADM